MKFIFFSAQYLPTVGGVERYTNSLARELVARGHSAVVVTCELDGLPFEQTDSDGIKIYRLPAKWFMNKRFPAIIPNKRFRLLKNKIENENANFAVIQTRFYMSSIFAARLCSKCHIPSIVVEHGSAHLINGGVQGFLGNVYEHLSFAIIRHYTKNIYAVSKTSGEWLAHFHSRTDKTLYNSVCPKSLLIQAQSTSTDFIYKSIHSIKPKIICFTGRFVKEKGVLPLANAFKEVVKEFPDSYLFMAGDGELFKAIENLNIPNLILTGNLSYPQSLALLNAADIFCLPTFSEGFSTSVLEAAALKTAIITTATGGSLEIILSPDHGILLPSMEISDIASALIFALSNDTWCKTATENAFAVLQEHFTWEKSADKLIQIASQLKTT